MKKSHICALFCGVSMLAALPAVTASAAETAGVQLMNTAFQTAQDQEFTTTVYLPKDSNISDFQAYLRYDPACVTLVKATAVKTEQGQVAVNAKKDGSISLTYSAEQNQTEKLNLVKLTFRVPDDLAEGKYDFLTLNAGSDNMASSLDEEGKFTDVKLGADFGTMDIYQYGDANLDGKVQSRDVTLLKQYIVKTKTLSPLAKIYANAYVDYEEDGKTPKVNSRDAGMIQQKVVRMDVNLGNRVSVTFYDADGNFYAKKSIPAGAELKNVPDLPFTQGITDGLWSLSAEEEQPADFSAVKSDLEVYFVGKKDEKRDIFERTVAALETGFAQEGKYIEDDFQLPYKNHYGTFNMLSSSEFSDVDIIWSIDSGLLARSVNISKEYVVDVPMLDYTTWVTFTANIYVDGTEYGKHAFKREIKGKIDMPSPEAFEKILASVPETPKEGYRLPGYVSLESPRQNYGVSTVQNVDMKWSVIKNEDGSTGDARCLDPVNNELIRLKAKNSITLQCEFQFEGNTVYTGRIARTLPAKSREGQIAYAKQYIESYVPSVISGETYFPVSVPLYDFTVMWEPPIETGKVVIGGNETVNGMTYKVISPGEKAGYMEWSTVYAQIERSGDKNFQKTGFDFDVQLAGNSSEITMDKIPDVNLYKTFVNIFDQKYGDHDGKLTEEEIYSPAVLEKLNYTMDLSGKGIKNLSGLRYLKDYRILNLSNNDLSGTNASLGDLASLNHLEQLSLSNCGISEIPDSVFASKYLIEGIDLSYNKLKNLNFLRLTDSRTAANLAFTELKELFLQGNYISDITELAFTDDSGEYVSRIPNVTVLTLSRDLNYVEYKTGKKLGKKVLKDADEYEYDIRTPMDITPLGPATKLATLWLANNFISDISPLSNCKLLATLDLSGNAIEASLQHDGLAPLSKLESLVCLLLDRNDIHTVKSLRKLTYLEVLSLSGNQIGNVSGIIDGMTLLNYLDLDGNQLTSFDASSFPRLTRLYLEDNELVQVINLDMAPRLTELRLSGNSVDANTIDSIAALTKLTYLSLSGNEAVDLGFLADLTALVHLELANCKLRQSSEIKHMDKETGEMVTDQIDNIECLRKLTGLKILDLSDNPELTDISGLSSLTNLVVFYLNGVKPVNAAAIRSMTKLEYLSMQNSGLSDFSFLNTLNQLRFLNLSGHGCATFDFRYLRSYDNLVGLFLDAAADSEVQNLNTFVGKTNLQYISLANMKIGSMDKIPDMENLIYLGLRNTGITDINGSFDENDGYLWSIDRFDSVKYLDVSLNPELFRKQNLETLFDFARKESVQPAVVLYRGDEPEGYVPGTLNAETEAKRLKNDISFGAGGTDISEALKSGYKLQTSLNGYDIEWNLEENDSYYIKDGNLYFKNTDAETANLQLSLTMNLLGLYYREDIEGSQEKTPVSFKASIQTETAQRKIGEQKVGTDYTTSSEKTLDGWVLDEDKTEMGYTQYGDWSSWSETPVTQSAECEVETEQRKGYSEWGSWTSWSDSAIAASDTRDVGTQTVSRSRVVGYNLVSNVTQGAASPHYRHYREFSIGGNYGQYNARSSYGEHNYTGSATVDQIKNARTIGPGGFFEGANRGYISGNATAYIIDENSIPWFISGEITENYNVTQYRYRDRTVTSTTVYRYRTRKLVPTVYHFHRDNYEDVFETYISGMTLKVE